MYKKILSAALSFVLLLSLVPAAFAASEEANTAADALYRLGLFNGTGTDANGRPVFDLDREPTRHESVTMLVRLLGKADEAASGIYATPFTDLAEWAKPYAGYAYANRLTSGTSDTTFGGEETTTAAQYITFVLRALGYETGTDFQWDKAWELSDNLGITGGRYNADTAQFTRGDMALISYNALSAKLKGKDVSFLDDLTARGAVAGHTHKYITKTVPGTGGHYEQVQVGTEQVLVRNERRQYIECQYCKVHFYDYDEYAVHTDPNYPYFKPGCAVCGTYIYTEYVPIYEEQPKYENRWVEDSASAIRVCEICGRQE